MQTYKVLRSTLNPKNKWPMGKGGAKKERGNEGGERRGLGLREEGRVGRGREGRRRGRKAGTILLGFQRYPSRKSF